MLLALFCLYVLLSLHQQTGYKAVKQIPNQEQVIVTGRIYKKELKKDDTLYYLNHVSIQGLQNTIKTRGVIVRIDDDTCRVGNQIQVKTQMRHFNQARNTGSFDEQAYYHSLGVSLLLYADSIQVVEKGKPCPVRNGLFWLRKQLRQIYSDTLNEKDAGILSSMILGDKSLMEDELKQLYSQAGISHILAVSGLHVSIIGMSLFQFLRKRGLKYGASCMISGLVLMGFCIMSGMSVSALRAGVMFLVFLGAAFLGRKYQSVRALVLAALISLYINPGYINNAGFWFSYLAVVGAVCIGQPFVPKGKSWHHKLVGTVVLSSSIMVTTLPLNAYYFYEIPLYSILANLVVIPLAGMVMGFGLLGGFLGLTGIPGMWIFLFPCHVILRLYEGICHGVSMLPSNVWIAGKPPIWSLCVYYGILLGLILVIHKDVGKLFLRKKGVLKKQEEEKTFKIDRYLRFLILPTLCMVLLFAQPDGRQFQVSFLDVGQGDGIYICGGDGRNYFVDGGSVSKAQLGRYSILPFLKYHGVRKIDGWFISHADTDHISGLLEVLESGYPVKTILVSQNAPQDENLEQLKDAAKKAGTQVQVVKNKSYVLGDGYQITCYTPGTVENKNRNETSLVLLFEKENDQEHAKGSEDHIFRILLTGDIGQEQEKWLLGQEPELTADILKAAHHGSKYSNGELFLQTVSPEVIVISAGENNQYGHPHEETLKRMKQTGSKVLQTMEMGEICIR